MLSLSGIPLPLLLVCRLFLPLPPLLSCLSSSCVLLLLRLFPLHVCYPVLLSFRSSSGSGTLLLYCSSVPPPLLLVLSPSAVILSFLPLLLSSPPQQAPFSARLLPCAAAQLQHQQRFWASSSALPRLPVFFRGETGGGVRSGPGEARIILIFHIISVRPSQQPLMVRTVLKVYMELGSYFLFLQEQIKDIIIICSVAPRR